MQALSVPAILEVIFHQLGLLDMTDNDFLFIIALWANHNSLNVFAMHKSRQEKWFCLYRSSASAEPAFACASRSTVTGDHRLF